MSGYQENQIKANNSEPQSSLKILYEHPQRTHLSVCTCTSDCMHVLLVTEMDRKEIVYLRVNKCWSHRNFFSRLQCDPWPGAVVGSAASNSPQSCSLECLLSCHVYSRSSPWPTAQCRMGCLTSGVPEHSSILPTKPLECVGPGLPCNLAWTELVHLAEEKQAQHLDGELLCKQSLLTMDTLTKRKDVSGHCGALTLEEQKSVLPLCWLGLSNENESWVPFSARCLSPRLSWFLAADAGFSWPRARAYSELQQLWDYSGFIDLSKEPQTCWAGVKPGRKHPGSYKSGSGNHSANGFHTLSNSSMITLPNILENVESHLFLKAKSPIYPIHYSTIQYNT